MHFFVKIVEITQRFVAEQTTRVAWLSTAAARRRYEITKAQVSRTPGQARAT